MLKETVYNTKPFKIELTDELIASNSGIAMAGIMLGSTEFTEAFDEAYYLMKKNFRRESTDKYIEFAKTKGCIQENPRKGKMIYYHSKYV